MLTFGFSGKLNHTPRLFKSHETKMGFVDCMFIPLSLRAEWSFCKCTNASFLPLLSSLMSLDKLCACMCVYVFVVRARPSHCANSLQFDPVLITQMKSTLHMPLGLKPRSPKPSWSRDECVLVCEWVGGRGSPRPQTTPVRSVCCLHAAAAGAFCFSVAAL